MAMYEILDAFKSKMGYAALAAFTLHMSILVLSISKRKAMCNIEERIENRRRQEMAFENYGLK